MQFVKARFTVISSRVEESWDSLRERVMDSSVASQIQTRWEEIEPKNRAYYKIGAALFLGFFLVNIGVDLVGSSYALKDELQNKKAAIELIQKAIDEERSIPRAQNGPEDLLPSISNLATTSGIDQAGLQLGAPTAAAVVSKNRVESTYELSIERTGLRQLVQYMVSLESNLARPIKIRAINIQKVDPTESSVQAKVEFSNFEVK